MRIENIIERVAPLAVLGDPSGLVINDVVFDHREASPGALFCCLVGEHADGHDFAAKAATAGAIAFVCEHSLGHPNLGVQLVVPPGAARGAMARAACAMYGDPSTALRTVGVTGTNGKTTVTYLLRSIFEHNAWHAGVIGTLDGVRTTPEAPDLQRALAHQRDAGAVAMALEVSSHALVQQRVEGINFDVAVFTNLTQDHLDFHETMEAYFEAKSLLFRPALARHGVVNADDPYGQRLLARPAIPMTPFSLADAVDLRVGISESTFSYHGHPVRLRLGGEFNVRNALGAAAAAAHLGVDAGAIAEGLSLASAVPGRFETIEDGGITAVVDYAHTPNGLEEVLNAARRALVPRSDGGLQPTPSRLIVVFGCGGDRDRGKRPAMGAIAARLADGTVITSDNPRSEDPKLIIDEIRAGMPEHTRVVIEPDRRRAIRVALSGAHPGDVVVVAGKGHETTQQFKDEVVHFDDREVVREELARLGVGGSSDLRHPA